MPGFPIRTSSDPRSVDSSPRHNAASHVLHRLPVPRHPPCALKHLHTKQIKKYSRKNKNCIIRTQKPTQVSAFRCSQPLSTNQTPHPTTKAGRQPQPTPNTGINTTSDIPHSGQRGDGLVVSKPNSVSGNLSRPAFPTRRSTFAVHRPKHPLQVLALNIPTATDPTGVGAGENNWCSLERR